MTATRLAYVGHATVLIDTLGVRILTDPLLGNRVAHLRRQAPPVDRDAISGIDLVLISHIHEDHLHLPSLRRLDPSARVIAPAGAVPMLERAGIQNVQGLHAGDTARVGGVTIVGTKARHSGFRYPFGPSAEPMGFVVRGSKSVYFAGDTDLFDEMNSLEPRLDLAVLPVWGWGPTLSRGHLNPVRAATALTMLQPRVAVPIHWGTYLPLGMAWMKPTFLTRPPADFQTAANRIAPEVEVRILEPGETAKLHGEKRNAQT
jgi:L-ascorbate metabolism protein UlaG (beta-lactamase superfamily)